MRITIHRGADQIGGCVTEYEYDGWRLFVDYGEQLPGAHKSDKPLEVEGLTKGDLSKSALLITHYHGDHIGCLHELSSELPIFIGKVARYIQQYASEHLRFVDENSIVIAERMKTANIFNPGVEFNFGPFSIIPIVMDHSAFDAYAFRIKADDLKVFHTGDFRTHGFRSGKLPKVIEKYVGKVDYVVCEATNINRPDTANESEHDLQKRFEQSFRDNKYNIVYLSSTNIDRLFGLYHAALRTGRPFYVDGYQRHIMDIVTEDYNVWSKSRLYKYGNYKPESLMRNGEEFEYREKFHDFLSQQGCVLIARASARFDNLIAKMPGEKKCYLSMWDGYLNPNSEAFNKDLASSLRDGYEYMHTSGHCDMESLKELLEMLSPKGIIPIHTDSPKAFAQYFSNRWPVIHLNDGESINPIGGRYCDDTDAMVLAVDNPTDEFHVVANDDNLKWWTLDQRHLGNFMNSDDAKAMLQSTVYASDRLLGRAVEEEEDMSPFCIEVYDPNFKQLNKYEWGGHLPVECRYQEMGWLKEADKVLAIIRCGFDVVVPCEIVGPITEEFLKSQTEADALCPLSYDEIKEDMWDWDWDCVVVRPLVRLANEYDTIPELALVHRVDIFPYKEFDL
jgi:ribonuclease J